MHTSKYSITKLPFDIVIIMFGSLVQDQKYNNCNKEMLIKDLIYTIISYTMQLILHIFMHWLLRYQYFNANNHAM